MTTDINLLNYNRFLGPVFVAEVDSNLANPTKLSFRVSEDHASVPTEVFNIQRDASTGGKFSISANAQSDAPSEGALTLTGGIGCGKNLYVGGCIHAGGQITQGSTRLPGIYLQQTNNGNCHQIFITDFSNDKVFIDFKHDGGSNYLWRLETVYNGNGNVGNFAPDATVNFKFNASGDATTSAVTPLSVHQDGIVPFVVNEGVRQQNPPEGTVIYNNTAKKISIYNGTQYIDAPFTDRIFCATKCARGFTNGIITGTSNASSFNDIASFQSGFAFRSGTTGFFASPAELGGPTLGIETDGTYTLHATFRFTNANSSAAGIIFNIALSNVITSNFPESTITAGTNHSPPNYTSQVFKVNPSPNGEIHEISFMYVLRVYASNSSAYRGVTFQIQHDGAAPSSNVALQESCQVMLKKLSL